MVSSDGSLGKSNKDKMSSLQDFPRMVPQPSSPVGNVTAAASPRGCS